MAAASRATVHETPLTRQDFDSRFDRCFARVWAYVRPRTDDHALCERIVTEVLERTLTLLVSQRDESQELRLLKAASDRLLGGLAETRVSAGNTRR